MKLSIVVQVITVSLQKETETPYAIAAQVLQASHSVSRLPGGFQWRTNVERNQGRQQSAVAVMSDKEHYKLANSILIKIHPTLQCLMQEQRL